MIGVVSEGFAVDTINSKSENKKPSIHLNFIKKNYINKDILAVLFESENESFDSLNYREYLR